MPVLPVAHKKSTLSLTRNEKGSNYSYYFSLSQDLWFIFRCLCSTQTYFCYFYAFLLSK
jgi:hypothetical protein